MGLHLPVLPGTPGFFVFGLRREAFKVAEVRSGRSWGWLRRAQLREPRCDDGPGRVCACVARGMWRVPCTVRASHGGVEGPVARAA